MRARRDAADARGARGAARGAAGERAAGRAARRAARAAGAARARRRAAREVGHTSATARLMIRVNTSWLVDKFFFDSYFYLQNNWGGGSPLSPSTYIYIETHRNE